MVPIIVKCHKIYIRIYLTYGWFSNCTTNYMLSAYCKSAAIHNAPVLFIFFTLNVIIKQDF